MPGQLFDGTGQTSFTDDGTSSSTTMDPVLLTGASPVAPIVRPDSAPVAETVPPQVSSALGQDQNPAMWPGSMVWGMGVNRVRVVKVRSFNFTHTWYKDNLSQEDIFANHVISMAVRRLRFGVQVRNFEFVRTWNGIGGIVYIPSFPQLERKETAWPHAT